MEFKWRKWNRATHRDLGYFFVGMILIYAISGIAVNHRDDWDPSYAIELKEAKLQPIIEPTNFTAEQAENVLEQLSVEGRYLKHYMPNSETIKVFFKGGNLVINATSGEATVETISRRPLFHAVNWFHYNPTFSWTVFSDIFAVALIILAASGLFILKGKNGIKGRGAILTIAGILVPVIYLIVFYF